MKNDLSIRDRKKVFSKGRILFLFVAVAIFGSAAFLYPVLKPISRTEVHLYGGHRLAPGATALYRVRAVDAVEQVPIENAEVELRISGSPRNTGRVLFRGNRIRTDENGMADFEVNIPGDAEEGNAVLEVNLRSRTGRARLSQEITIERSFVVDLVTDRPAYQPGQTILIRGLVLNEHNGVPAPSQNVLLQITDPEGDTVLHRNLIASDSGVISSKMPLARQMREGPYTIIADAGAGISERTVNVSYYRLPRFTVSLKTDPLSLNDRVHEILEARIEAMYTFGEPVAGGAVFWSLHPEGRPDHTLINGQGILDPNGRLNAKIRIDRTILSGSAGGSGPFLNVLVRDNAGHEQYAVSDIIVKSQHGHEFPSDTPRAVEPGIRILADKSEYRGGDTIIASVFSGPHKYPVLVDLVHNGLVRAAGRIQNADGHESIKLKIPDEVSGNIILRAYPEIKNRPRRSSSFHSGSTDFRGRHGHGSAIPNRMQVGRVGRQASSQSINPESYAVQIPVLPKERLFITPRSEPPLSRPGENVQLEFKVETENRQAARAVLAVSGVDTASLAAARSLEPRTNGNRNEMGHIVLPGPLSGSIVTLPDTWDQQKKNRETAIAERLSFLGIAGIFVLQGISLILLGGVIRRLFRGLFTGAPVGNASEMEIARAQSPLILGFLTLWSSYPFLFILCPLLVGSVMILLDFDFRKVAPAISIALFLVMITVRILMGIMAKRLSPAIHYKEHIADKSAQGNKPDSSESKSSWLSPMANTAFLVLLWVPPIIILTANMDYDLTVRAGISIVLGGISSLIILSLGTMSIAVIWRGLVKPMKKREAFLALLSSGCISMPLILILLFSIFSIFGDNFRRAFGASADSLAGTASVFNISDIFPGQEHEAADAQGLEETDSDTPRLRYHFPETLLWISELITDKDGRAMLDVPLPDSITTWRISVDAHDIEGARGRAEMDILSFQPFFVDIDLPPVLNQFDRITVPIAVHNHLEEPTMVQIRIPEDHWFRIHGTDTFRVYPGPKEVRAVPLSLEVLSAGNHSLQVIATGKSADAVERQVQVLPYGRPIETVRSGLLDGHLLTLPIEVPEEAIEGVSEMFMRLYPGAYSQIIEGMEGLLGVPYGCFEQSTSVTYPNVLLLSYMKSIGDVEPEIIERAENLLLQGYQRFLSFEQPGGGFGYFRRSQQSAPLNAYALMLLSDMSKVHPVEDRILIRTARALVSMQNSNGSWDLSHHAGNEKRIRRTTAYAAWALAESLSAESLKEHGSHSGIRTAIDRSLRYLLLSLDREQTDDPYFTALAANALLAAGHERGTEIALRLLDSAHEEDDKVFWDAGGSGVTHSFGNALHIETTALAAHALLSSHRNVDFANKALDWLAGKRDFRGTWTTTQATIQTLRALVAASGTTSYSGPAKISIRLDNGSETEILIDEDADGVAHFVDLAEIGALNAGEIRIQSDEEINIAYQLVARHYLHWDDPQDGPSMPDRKIPHKAESLDLAIHYDPVRFDPGEEIVSTANIRWSGDESLIMPTLEIGIPAGFEIINNDLDILAEKGLIANYETRPGGLVIYLESLDPDESQSLPFRLRHTSATLVSAPPSHAYAYYTPSIRASTSPVTLAVRTD